MAAYVTREELSHLSIAGSALAGVNSWDIDRALEAASRIADSYLTSKFQLPLSAWGDDLKQKVADLAAYNILKVRGFDPQSGSTETLRDGFTDAMKWLGDVSTGKARPTGVVDASGSLGNNTDAAGEARRSLKIVQLQPESSSPDDFWGAGGTSGGTVGKPRRRGF